MTLREIIDQLRESNPGIEPLDLELVGMRDGQWTAAEAMYTFWVNTDETPNLLVLSED